jgi:predicted glycoside hydrolase/deacetylase ChbG (UPF0249 family)
MINAKTKLIINADDLGASSHINRSISSMINQGIITSSTIMANSPVFNEVAEIVEKHPNCSFGVHLNITEFKPLTDSPFLSEILDLRGSFSGNIRNIDIDKNLSNAVFNEWCLQIEKVQSLGIEVSHIDAHGHVHTIPDLKPTLMAVLREMNINKMRRISLSQNILEPGQKDLSSDVEKIISTEAFADYKTFRSIDSKLLSSYKSIEIMMHPGFPEDSDEGRENIDILNDFHTLKENYELINYKQL